MVHNGTGSELDDNERIDTEYEGDIRVVEVEREGDPNLFRFEAPGHKTKRYDLGPEFENPHAARLYAAVYVVAEFREEKTGRRGLPRGVVDAGQEAVVAYQRCHPGKDADWLALKHDIDRQRVYEYTSRLRERATDKREKLIDPDE